MMFKDCCLQILHLIWNWTHVHVSKEKACPKVNFWFIKTVNSVKVLDSS